MFNNELNIELITSTSMSQNLPSILYKNKINEIINDMLKLDVSQIQNIDKSGGGTNTNDNIFYNLYNCFQNYLLPLGTLNNEQDFLFCIFNTNNPITKLNPEINVSLSEQYQFTITYSNQNDLYLFPMSIYYVTKKILTKIMKIDTKIYNIGYYLLPESLTKISDLDSILYLLPDDILLCSYCIHYIMSNMGFQKVPNITPPNLISNKTLESLLTIELNILTKILFSTITAIISAVININPFKYNKYFDNLKLEIIKDKPLISNQCIQCTNVTKFKTIFINPKIISCDIIINETNKIQISKTNFYWYELFDKLNITLFQTNILFNDNYVIKLDSNLNILKSLLQLFYIREELIYVTPKGVYLILKDKLYAKASDLISIKMLPGLVNISKSNDYIKSFSLFYNTDEEYYKIIIKNGLTYLNSSLFELVIKSLQFIKQYNELSCSQLITNLDNLKLDNFHKCIYIYLLHKHIQTGSTFNEELNFKSNVNDDLFIYSLSLDIMFQSSYSITGYNDTVIIFNPNNPDLDLLLQNIELFCTSQFDSLTNKNNLNKYCRCLYRPGSYLSPYCFDQGCKNWISNENSIYIKYPCKYPVCSQSIDFTNMLSNTLDLNKITQNISCGAFSNTTKFQPGNYNIYFKTNTLYWSIETAKTVSSTDETAIIVSSTPSQFRIDYINEILTIYDITVQNNQLKFSPNSKLSVIIGLINNNIYLIHKKYNYPIYTDGKNVLCDYKDVNMINCTIVFVKK